jgi:hypothetical protein
MSSSEEEEEEHKSSEEAEESDPESEEEQAPDDPLKLQPPTFSLPDDDEYELWTIRMPISVDHSALDGIKLSLDKKQLGMIESGSEKFGVVLGDAFENESFRVLVEDDNGLMIPSNVPFAKHLNLVHGDAIKEIPETDLAPGIERAPAPADPVRKAYSVVPQKAGLKRRWMPNGVPPAASRTDTAQYLMAGLVEFHTKNVQKSATEIKDVSPVKSPPPKRRRKSLVDDDSDDDLILTQESTTRTPTSRKIKVEAEDVEEKAQKKKSATKVKKENDEEPETKQSAKKVKKEDGGEDEKKQSAKKAKKDAKQDEKEQKKLLKKEEKKSEKKAKKEKRKSKE